MIIFYDKNYPPLAILEINSFLEKDYKTFVKLFNSIIEIIKSHPFQHLY